METTKQNKGKFEGLVSIVAMLSGFAFMSGAPTDFLARYTHSRRYERISENISRSNLYGSIEFRYNSKVVGYDYNRDGELDFQISHFPFRLCGALGSAPSHPAWNKKMALSYSEEFRNIDKKRAK